MSKRIEHQVIGGVEVKLCCRCKKWKALIEFSKNRVKRDGLSPICKECNRIADNSRNASKRTIPVPCGCGCGGIVWSNPKEAKRTRYIGGHYARIQPRSPNFHGKRQKTTTFVNGVAGMVCTKCFEWKPLSEYNRRLDRAIGYYPKCKDCISERSAKYRETNHEELLSKKKVYARANSKHCTQKMREWELANPERAKELRDSRNHARRARIISGGRWTADEWEWLFGLLGKCCVKCGRSIDLLTKLGIKVNKDHIHPVAMGGMNVVENLQPLCEDCHKKKPRKETIDYRPQWLVLGFQQLKAQAGL